MATCHPTRRYKALGLCGPCYRAQWQARRRVEDDLVHHKWRLKKYDLTPDEYAIKFKEQNGCCAICHKKFSRRLCVDHSHVTGLNRGLLYTACNLGLENFKEDITALEQAILYLKKWNG
jgi:hypothetical protein